MPPPPNSPAPTPTSPSPPAITTCPDAIDAADRKNNLTQSVIGAKEGATEAVTVKVGARVTDTVLRTSDGTDYKSVDEYELFQLINAVMQAADRPRVREVRQQMVDTLATKFNFQQRFLDNVAVLRAQIARLPAYGITINEDVVAAIILAEADKAARKLWGREIETAADKIRLRYGYDHAHDAQSVAVILTELAAADGVRNLMRAPSAAASSVRMTVTDVASWA